MFNFEDYDEKIDDSESPEPITKDKLLSFDNKKLCAIIVSSRYLSINKELSILCMEELANRRVNGDNFNYEDYIEQKSKTLPSININSGIYDLISKFNKK